MNLHRTLNLLLGLVWLAMGLGCKVLGLVPRHREIVARILGDEVAPGLAVAIGVGEIGIALWILSGIRPRLCAIVQVVLVAGMNVLEFLLARDLLLFGAGNALAAAVFIAMVLWTERLRRCSPR